ncbi:glycosyltransferase family 39 protein [Cellulomonas sp. ICMP 17802]|uniref:glycosyltransferase family 39 protein n=1 Tax=Cellulomonas sp. ICMP 17802 TaxID=3239199 RepID=UPI00351AC116
MGSSAAQTRRSTTWLVTAVVAVLAVAVRWRLVGGAQGLRSYHGYDDGVYFASAMSFVHGAVPYRDFLLLHPPGIMLALAPFAALAHWTSDSTAFAAARVAFILVGAASTVLVTRIARRWGTVAAVVAGVLYALSSAAAYADRLTLLEPLGTLTLLGAVVLLLRAAESRVPARWQWAAGAVLGLGVVVKIWAVVPAAIVVAWQLWTQGRRPALRTGVGALVSTAVVVAPFAVLAGPRMFRLVVQDQLGRPREHTSTVARLGSITGVDVTVVPGTDPLRTVLVALVLAGIAAAAVVAWRGARGRLWVVLLVVQSGVLLASPSYLPHYAAYPAPALVLVVAAAVSLVPAPSRLAVATATCLALGLVGGALAPAPQASFPAAQIRERLPEQGCVRSDSPAALVLLDVYSRDLARGCDVPVDLSGQTYDEGSRDAQGRPVPRVENQQWQHAAVRYLTSGAATVLARGTGNGFDAETTEELHELTTVYHLHGVRLLLPGAATDDD